ncbi:hypothetical protein M9194_04550 [Vibrio sp. S4M6]|uniref:LA_2272 family surface repeat-containing protein n=1 Tax=Vibrio sinus TaxID=2946865 RepID=UPI00202A29C7|nr:hypothetical protein [Vibrio sinus]MCL9780707.1 hypothetical protein [Vibrio sinus]
MNSKIVLILALVSLSGTAMAATNSPEQTKVTESSIDKTRLQLSLPGTNWGEGNVSGARVALFYGRTDKVTGFNYTVLGVSDVKEFKGFQLGFLDVNRNRVDMQGAQFGLANWNDNTATGGSFGLLNYTGEQFTGAQFGLVNWNDNNASSASLGLVNYTGGKQKGVQLGLANYAEELTGLQLGLFNATSRIDEGVQIGLINVETSGTVVSKNIPVLPIVNARF